MVVRPGTGKTDLDPLYGVEKVELPSLREQVSELERTKFLARVSSNFTSNPPKSGYSL
jgi:hypothetical protein